jgi:putative aldouronate transport system permease protein
MSSEIVTERSKNPFNMKRVLGFNFYDVFVLVFCVTFAFICFYPLWYVFVASITPYQEYVKGGLLVWPTTGVDLQYYKAIFSTKSFVNSMGISVSKTVLATLLSLLVTSAMAYGVSKVHVRGMKVINALVVFNLFFTGGLIPEYMLYKDTGLLHTYWVMVIPGALNITYFIIMRNFFYYSVPVELEEAARIDGCNDIGVFFRVVIPLSRPLLAAVGLFVAVINWNDYYSYMMFISNKTQLQPFAWILRRMLTDQSMMNQVRNGAVSLGLQLPPPMALRMATIICAMLPIMCVYPFLQKHFASGMTLGAVKE